MSKLEDVGPENAASRSISGRHLRSVVILTLLSTATVLGYVDRQILALLMQPIKRSLGLSDLALGELQGLATSLSYALASIPMGRLVDTHNRRNLMAACVLCWSMATVLCGLANTYRELFAWRVVVGVSEAALFPAAYSLMADLFDAPRRVSANLVFYVLGLLGSTGALAVGGLSERLITGYRHELPAALSVLASWRLTFMVIGLPGVGVAALFMLLREPKRSDVSTSSARFTQTRRFVAANRATYLLLYGLTFGSSVAIATIVTWYPTILVRIYASTVSSAGIATGIVLCVASVSGVALGGLWNRARKREAGDAQAIQVLVTSMIVSCAALAAMTTMTSKYELEFSLGGFVLAFFTGYALIPSLIVSISPSGASGQLVAIYILASMSADAVQSTLVGTLSDNLFRGPKALLHAAVVVAITGTIIGAIAAWQLPARYRRTAARLPAPVFE